MIYPYNAKTKEHYSESNTLTLIASGYQLPQWATYRQWASIGYQVKRGSKGTRLKRVCTKEEKGKVKKYVKGFTVFNLAQVKPMDTDLNNCTPEEFTKYHVDLLEVLIQNEDA